MSGDGLGVLIVEDHPLFRDGLRLLLEDEPGIDVVGVAATGEEGLAAAVELQPDVVVMDLQLPDIHGLEATRRILAVSPHVQILVLTMFDDDDSVFAAMRAGARGYVLKGSDQADVVRAVEAVGRGDAIFGPGVANRLLGFFAARQSVRRHEAFPELTPREREVLDLIATGLSNDLIARRLLLKHQDGAQPHLQRLHQAPGDRQVRGDRPRAPGRTGRRIGAMRPVQSSSPPRLLIPNRWQPPPRPARSSSFTTPARVGRAEPPFPWEPRAVWAKSPEPRPA